MALPQPPVAQLTSGFLERGYLTVKCGINPNHTICTQLALDIVRGVNYGHQYDNNFLLKYLLYLDSSQHNYYSCYSRTDWVRAVTSICSKITPTVDNQIKLVIGGEQVIPIFKSIIDKGDKIDTRVLKQAIAYLSKGTWSYIKLVELLVNHTSADSECLVELCKHSGSRTQDWDLRYRELVRSMLNQKLPLTAQCLIWSASNSEVVDILIQYGCPVTVDALEAACRNRQEASIKRIIQCKVVPDKICFKALFNGIYSYAGCTCNQVEIIATCIDLLVSAGYSITYEDVLYALDYNCYINNIGRFNIKFDNKFLEACARRRYHPYNETDINIKPTVECLKIECAQIGNLPRVTKLVAQGVKPTQECLQIACKNQSNVPIISYLITEQGLKPDLTCLQNVAKHSLIPNLNLLLGHIDDTVNQTHVEKQLILDKKRADELATVKTPPSSDTESEPAARSKPVPIVGDTKASKGSSKGSSKQSDMEKLTAEPDLSEEFKDFDIDIDVKSTKKGKKLKNINIVDGDSPDSNSNSGQSVSELKLSNVSIPKDKRIKTVVKPDAVKLLRIRGGNSKAKVSFFELRKLVLTYVHQYDLCTKDSDGNPVIKPNKEMWKALSLGSYRGHKYVRFENFDKLVSACYPS